MLNSIMVSDIYGAPYIAGYMPVTLSRASPVRPPTTLNFEMGVDHIVFIGASDA